MKGCCYKGTVLVLSLLALGACDNSRAQLRFADRQYAAGNYGDAIVAYQQLLDKDPLNAVVIRKIALAQYQEGQPVQAFAYLLKVLASDPSDVEALNTIGRIYLAEADGPAALEQANAVLTIDAANSAALALLAAVASTPAEVDAALPRLQSASGKSSDATLQLALARLHAIRGDTSAARQIVTSVVSTHPDLAVAERALAVLDSRDSTQDTTVSARPSVNALRDAELALLVVSREEAERQLYAAVIADSTNLGARRVLAQLKLGDGDTSAIYEQLDAVLKSDYRDADALVLRGRGYLVAHRANDAIADLRGAATWLPGLAPAHMHLGLAHIAALDAPAAKVDLERALEISPNYGEATLHLADLHTHMGVPGEAILALNSMIARRPSARAYWLLGAAHLANSQPDRAADAYQALSKITPANPEVFVMLGTSRRDQRLFGAAVAAFDSALALAPGRFDATTGLIETYAMQGRNNDALAYVQREIAKAPESAVLQDLLGIVQVSRAQLPAAEAAFTRAIQLDESLADAHARLGELYGRTGRSLLAEQALGKALAIDPSRVEAVMLLAVLYHEQHQLGKAQAMYERALTVSPRNAMAANNLALLLDELGGEPRKALLLAEGAYQISPDNPTIANTLGWLLFKSDSDAQRAITLLEESANKLPSNPVVQYQFAVAANQQGNKEAARAALVRALSVKRDFAEKEQARQLLSELGNAGQVRK